MTTDTGLNYEPATDQCSSNVGTTLRRRKERSRKILAKINQLYFGTKNCKKKKTTFQSII